MIMSDARVSTRFDLLTQLVALQYLSTLVDADRQECIEYLTHLPLVHNNVALGMISGVPGAGKSDLAAHLTITVLLRNPTARVGVFTSGNQPADVLIQKINVHLTRAVKDPAFAEILDGRFACRVYTDTSEGSYLVTLATAEYGIDDEDEEVTAVLTNMAEICKAYQLRIKSTESSKYVVEQAFKKSRRIPLPVVLPNEWESSRSCTQVRKRQFSVSDSQVVPNLTRDKAIENLRALQAGDLARVANERQIEPQLHLMSLESAKEYIKDLKQEDGSSDDDGAEDGAA